MRASALLMAFTELLFLRDKIVPLGRRIQCKDVVAVPTLQYRKQEPRVSLDELERRVLHERLPLLAARAPHLWTPRGDADQRSTLDLADPHLQVALHDG